MNDSISTSTTEFVFRRFEEPLRLFGKPVSPFVWIVILGAVLLVGFFYIGWMYVRDSKAIGIWAILLGLLRASVYALLVLVFLMPAQQTWHQANQRTKVVLMYDVSLSMSMTSDLIPTEGKKFSEMPTRTELMLERLGKNDFAFLRRIEENNPITAFRFGRLLDNEFLFYEKNADKELHFWPKSEREKILAARSRDDRQKELEQRPGRPLHAEHLKSWLTPMVEAKLVGEWKDSTPRGAELKRQLESNNVLKSTRFFEGTAVGEAVLEVLKQEQNNMVEGIVLFTDGRLTEGSASAVTEAAKAAANANIPVFVVQVGEVRPKVAIDVVDISVAPVIRPEDKFRVIVTVNGQDMPTGEEFPITLEMTRVVPAKDKADKDVPKAIELVELDEKGNIVSDTMGKDKTTPLTTEPNHKIVFKEVYAKEKPVFKIGNPPSCQVEYELDAATLAKAAGKTLKPGEKVGLAPDDEAVFRFRAIVPLDKRELPRKDEKTGEPIKEHVSDNADMRVLKKPLRVLLFASVATQDYKFLRSLLVREMDKGRADLCIHLQTVPGAERRTGIVQDIDAKRILPFFPTKRISPKGDDSPYLALTSYDVVVSFDANWEDLSPDQTKLLADWVEKDGGGLVFIAGQIHTQEVASPLNNKEGSRYKPLLDMLPVVPEYSQKEEATTDVPRRLLFPQSSGELEFMRLDERDSKADWEKGWARFFDEIQDEDGTTQMKPRTGDPERGIFSYYPIKSVKANAQRLATIDAPTALLGTTGQKQPWLSSAPWGKGKVMWIGSGETWRLRMYKEEYHERFWTKLLRDVGSQSINTMNRRITPNMSRYGVVNKFQSFEARFEDINGNPLKNTTKPPPKLIVTPPQTPEVKDRVLIKLQPKVEGKEDKDRELRDFDGKKATVVEVFYTPDAEGNRLRKLRIDNIESSPDRKAVKVIDSTKVEVLPEEIAFRAKLGDRDDRLINQNNDGVFKVDYQPRRDGVHKMQVIYPDSPDNLYNHTFDVKESKPETDNVKPDLEVLWELASPAKEVLKKPDVSDETKKQLRALLKRPDGLARKDGEAKKPDVRGDEERAAGDDSMRLLFDLSNSEIIPDCLTKKVNNIRNRGKVEDMWDKGMWEVENEQGEKKALMPWVLLLGVGLLSIEWLTRKLLRLA